MTGRDLHQANFYEATLTGADLSGANVRGATFFNTPSRGFTASQLYATASY